MQCEPFAVTALVDSRGRKIFPVSCRHHHQLHRHTDTHTLLLTRREILRVFLRHGAARRPITKRERALLRRMCAVLGGLTVCVVKSAQQRSASVRAPGCDSVGASSPSPNRCTYFAVRKRVRARAQQRARERERD